MDLLHHLPRFFWQATLKQGSRIENFKGIGMSAARSQGAPEKRQRIHGANTRFPWASVFHRAMGLILGGLWRRCRLLAAVALASAPWIASCLNKSLIWRTLYNQLLNPNRLHHWRGRNTAEFNLIQLATSHVLVRSTRWWPACVKSRVSHSVSEMRRQGLPAEPKIMCFIKNM